jgi:hypothetical protein
MFSEPILKFFAGIPLNEFNNLNVLPIILYLIKKNAEIGKTGYSEDELCKVASNAAY